VIDGHPLEQPWGFTVAPNNFGPLSNTLLISNNTNRGTIHAFNIPTGQYVGTVRDCDGEPIRIDQLWGIVFGGGNANNGQTNQLFFAAGPKNNLAGTLGHRELENVILGADSSKLTLVRFGFAPCRVIDRNDALTKLAALARNGRYKDPIVDHARS
jgi:hypothetical protein